MSATSHASRVVLDACPLCDARDWTLLVEGVGEGFDWARCRCGAVFKHREPDRPAESGAAHYDADYFRRYARRRGRRVSKSRRQILDAAEALHRGPGGAVAGGGEPRLLDVGCSLGYTLEAARGLGFEAAGVDRSPVAVDACRLAGFDAREGDVEALPFEDATFSVVVLKHVFEHTPTPRRALAELARVLRPGGAAFFAVPDLRYRRASERPEASRFFRGEAGRAHFVYYRPDTLAALVSGAGFRVAGVHPRLLHRRAGAGRLLLDAAAAPWRAALEAAREALSLRKEFWLVAVRAALPYDG